MLSLFFKIFATSNPESFGRFISKIIKSGLNCSIFFKASNPSKTVSVSYLDESIVFNTEAKIASSSTMRIFFIRII